MRAASSSGRPSRRTLLRTAVAMSRAEPASAPAALRTTPSTAVITSPYSANEGSSEPTIGIASVTRKILPRGLAARATRNAPGCTCTPSTITPHQLSRSSSAAPTAPGSRPCSGDIALYRWVKPHRPASSPARVSS